MLASHVKHSKERSVDGKLGLWGISWRKSEETQSTKSTDEKIVNQLPILSYVVNNRNNNCSPYSSGDNKNAAKLQEGRFRLCIRKTLQYKQESIKNAQILPLMVSQGKLLLEIL